jgi:hypothetical protein
MPLSVFVMSRVGHNVQLAPVRCGKWRPGEDKFPAAARSDST